MMACFNCEIKYSICVCIKLYSYSTACDNIRKKENDISYYVRQLITYQSTYVSGIKSYLEKSFWRYDIKHLIYDCLRLI